MMMVGTSYKTLVVRMEVYPAQGQFPRAQNSENLGVQWAPKHKNGQRPRVPCRLVEVWG